MEKFDLIPYNDPYDLWATNLGQNVRTGFYNNRISSKFAAAFIAACELFIPSISRKLLKTNKSLHPITAAQYILLSNENSWITKENIDNYIDLLIDQAAINESDCLAFGLGFVWVSKNGTYSKDKPFVTHTPYAMEALLALRVFDDKNLINSLFNNTFTFLESLKVMKSDDSNLALSYAPILEPRIVINANSYAAFSYALHHNHNPNCDQEKTFIKVRKITNWIISQQQTDGSWLYYADNMKGNFIDCFHSCFVIKNLIKVKNLMNFDDDFINASINKGVRYIKDSFYKNEIGLVTRFSFEDIKDPYKFILYDQAEYLGILIDTGDLDFARTFIDNVNSYFKDGDVYYSQIDFLGRKVGKEYMRWGIISYLFQVSRFNTLRKQSCVV